MKAKVSRGSGFGGLARYISDEELQTKSAERVGGNLPGRSAREWIAGLAATRQIRPEIERPVWHCSLSQPAGEAPLTAQQWDKIGADFMQRMGFSASHPWVLVRHSDQDHDHAHIMASRIAYDGTVWLGQWEARTAIEATQQLEREHGLTRTKGLNDERRPEKALTRQERHQAERTGEEAPRTVLQRLVVEAAVGSPTALEFAIRLEDRGVGVRANLASTGKLSGFSFEYAGIAFKGSDLGEKFKWSGLQKAGVTYVAERDREGLSRFRAAPATVTEIPAPAVEPVPIAARVDLPPRQVADEHLALALATEAALAFAQQAERGASEAARLTPEQAGAQPARRLPALAIAEATINLVEHEVVGIRSLLSRATQQKQEPHHARSDHTIDAAAEARAAAEHERQLVAAAEQALEFARNAERGADEAWGAIHPANQGIARGETGARQRPVGAAPSAERARPGSRIGEILAAGIDLLSASIDRIRGFITSRRIDRIRAVALAAPERHSRGRNLAGRAGHDLGTEGRTMGATARPGREGENVSNTADTDQCRRAAEPGVSHDESRNVARENLEGFRAAETGRSAQGKTLLRQGGPGEIAQPPAQPERFSPAWWAHIRAEATGSDIQESELSRIAREGQLGRVLGKTAKPEMDVPQQEAQPEPSDWLHDMAREGRLDVALAKDRLHVESLGLLDEDDKTVIEVADASGHGHQIPAALRAAYEAAHAPPQVAPLPSLPVVPEWKRGLRR